MKAKPNKTDILALRSDNKRLRQRVNKLLDKLAEAETDLDEACDEGVPREVHNKILADRDEMIIQLKDDVALYKSQAEAYQRMRDTEHDKAQQLANEVARLRDENRHLEEEIETDLQLEDERNSALATAELQRAEIKRLEELVLTNPGEHNNHRYTVECERDTARAKLAEIENAVHQQLDPGGMETAIETVARAAKRIEKLEAELSSASAAHERDVANAARVEAEKERGVMPRRQGRTFPPSAKPGRETQSPRSNRAGSK